MKRNEIKNLMLERISETLEAEFEEHSIEDRITPDHINDFLWNKDFGMGLVEDYIDNHEDDLIEAYLEEIYNDLDSDDLTTPW